MLGDVTRRPPHAAVRAYSAIAYASFAVTTLWAIAFLTDLPVVPVIDDAHPGRVGDGATRHQGTDGESPPRVG